MTGPVFVDTNVLIYARDPADPGKQTCASEWLAALWRERSGRTSVQVLSEFYVNVTRKLARPVAAADAWREVESLLAWQPQPIDRTLLTRAHEVEARWRLNWWDAMLVAAAQTQDCTILLSEDFQDGASFGNVTVRSPFTSGVNEEPGSYEASPAPIPRHRGRGRPRKRAATG